MMFVSFDVGQINVIVLNYCVCLIDKSNGSSLFWGILPVTVKFNGSSSITITSSTLAAMLMVGGVSIAIGIPVAVDDFDGADSLLVDWFSSTWLSSGPSLSSVGSWMLASFPNGFCSLTCRLFGINQISTRKKRFFWKYWYENRK